MFFWPSKGPTAFSLLPHYTVNKKFPFQSLNHFEINFNSLTFTGYLWRNTSNLTESRSVFSKIQLQSRWSCFSSYSNNWIKFCFVFLGFYFVFIYYSNWEFFTPCNSNNNWKFIFLFCQREEKWFSIDG